MVIVLWVILISFVCLSMSVGRGDVCCSMFFFNHNKKL
jgi:hypothetical protein